MPNSYRPFDQIQLGLTDLSEEPMKTATLFLLSILAAPAVGQTVYKCSDFGRNQSSAPLGQATRRSRAEGGWIGMFA